MIFRKSGVIFLGHRISSAGISTSPSKREYISQFRATDSMRLVASIFVDSNFFTSIYAQLPTDSETLEGFFLFLNIKYCNIVLSDSAMATFRKIKSVLSHDVELCFIVSGKELYLAFDASSIAVDAVL